MVVAAVAALVAEMVVGHGSIRVSQVEEGVFW